jgi:glucokinase-like ROK family protein
MERLRVDAQVARELNRATVFDFVRTERVVSRVGLAEGTGLSKATISEIVDQFIRDGFLRTLGPGTSNGGRRPTMLEFAPRARLAIGVELGDAVCRALLTDLNAEPIESRSVQVRARSAEDALAAAGDLVAELAGNLTPGTLLGIGVGTPGLVDSRSGVIRVAPDLDWRDVPVGARLSERFGVPVAVVNRAKAAALGEDWCGAGREVHNLVYVSVSTGVAAGIVIDGRLYRGVSMSEGELGHVTVLPDGPLCPCGNRGCLQTLAAGPAVVARVREELRKRGSAAERPAQDASDAPTLEAVAEAAAAGDQVVLRVLDEVAEYLGIAAANLVNTLNPGLLILGGSVVRALPDLVPKVRAVVRRRAMPVPTGAVTVVPSQLGREAVTVGAAAFLLGQVSVVGSVGLRATGVPAPSIVRPPTRPEPAGVP